MGMAGGNMKSYKNGGAPRVDHRQGRLCHYFFQTSQSPTTPCFGTILCAIHWLEACARGPAMQPLKMGNRPILGRPSLPPIVGQASLPVDDARSAAKINS